MMTTDLTYSRPSSVVCIGGTAESKAAALYFDQVLPLMYADCPHGALFPDYDTNKEIQTAITMINLVAMQYLPRAGDYGALPINRTSIVGSPDGRTYHPKHLDLDRRQQQEADSIIVETYLDPDSQFRKAFAHFIERHFPNIPLIAPSAPLTSIPATTDDVSVLLAGLPMVDTDKATWEQILEFRADEGARSKLRRLRLFAYDQLRGKSRQHIEDVLSNLLEDHEAAAKDHGFDLVTGSLTTIANSKSLLSIGGAALAAALIGAPIAASVTALAGVSVEVAKISIQIAQKKHAFHKLERDHPLAYILEARKRL